MTPMGDGGWCWSGECGGHRISLWDDETSWSTLLRLQVDETEWPPSRVRFREVRYDLGRGCQVRVRLSDGGHVRAVSYRDRWRRARLPAPTGCWAAARLPAAISHAEDAAGPSPARRAVLAGLTVGAAAANTLGWWAHAFAW